MRCANVAISLLVLLCAAAVAQEHKIQAPADIAKLHDALPDQQYTAKVANTSYVAPSGERVLQHEIDVPVSLEEAWTTLTTADGLRTFVAPVALVELKSGGCYCTNYRPGTRIGDPGTINNRVLSYVPQQMLSAKINLAEIFPPQPKAENTLFLVMEFQPRDAKTTHLKASLLGFGTGEQWDQVYKFFESGNAYTFGQLYKRFVEGPRKWPAAMPATGANTPR